MNQSTIYRCSKCGELKSSDSFHNGNPNRTRPVSAYCKPCKAQHRRDNKERYRATTRRYYQANKEKYLEKSRRSKQRPEIKDKARDAYLKRTYGISNAEYHALVRLQGDRCAICKRDKPPSTRGHWHIDHCHKTNKIRGLLCHDCNVGLGKFKDDPNALVSASDYLRRSA